MVERVQSGTLERGQTATVSAAAGRRGRKPGLSRDQIARVALEMIDREGLERFTMQRVAERVGVGTMTLYGYFGSKDELLQAVVDAAVERPQSKGLGRPSEPRPTEALWQDQLRAVVTTAYRTLSRHPALVEIRFRQPILRPDALRFGERIVGILRQAGFDAAQAAGGFRLIFTYTFGFAGLSPAAGAQQAREQAARAAASLPAERFPNLTATAAEWTRAMAGSEQFEYGLDRIIDGLEARLARVA
jgi:AcrR family transcriptional regulator